MTARFAFQVEHLPAQLERAVLASADRIDGGSFYVRIERRGHAGDIHSQPLEQGLDRTVLTHLREQGAAPLIDFKDPDAIVAVELIGDECGVGDQPPVVRPPFKFLHAMLSSSGIFLNLPSQPHTSACGCTRVTATTGYRCRAVAKWSSPLRNQRFLPYRKKVAHNP